MTTTIHTPPTDPETVALDLIVRIGGAVPGATALAGAMRHFAVALELEGALSPLTSVADARRAAVTIAEVAVSADDPVGALRIRAAAVRAGCWDCSNAGVLADTLDAAATVLDAM